MESVSGKAFDANRKLDEISGLLKEYRSVVSHSVMSMSHGENVRWDVLHDMSVKIVGGLKEVMKVADDNLSDRACEVVDEISKIYGNIWNFTSKQENAGEPLMSLLKELARKVLSLR